MSIVRIEEANLFGWEGFRFCSGDIVLGLAPQIGGRIISLTHRGEELLFCQDDYKGETYPLEEVSDLRTEKRRMGFRLWGGDKTWVAPQLAWWEAIPPLDLDAGAYSVEMQGVRVQMTSPLCRETGLRVIRTVELTDDGQINLDQTFRNEGGMEIQKGIWDVTQVLRPFEVYLPASKTDVRAYEEEGDPNKARQKLEARDPWVKITCDESLAFKFGGRINRGRVLAVRNNGEDTLVWDRRFEIFPQKRYAHEAMVEVFNSPKFNYLEIEVHAPLVPLRPGDSFTHRQVWKIVRVLGPDRLEQILNGLNSSYD